MKVKDQLRMRRTQLGISVGELAKRLGVSAQAVRHWENGRSFPGKSKTAALETALSFNIDWTEGARAGAKRPNVNSLIDPNDVALLLQIARLPPPAKALIGDLVQMHLEALGTGTEGLERIKESSARPFFEREQGEDRAVEAARPQERARKTSSKRPVNRHSTRRKAA